MNTKPGTRTVFNRILATLILAMMLLAVVPAKPAYATAATYNFQAMYGVTVAPGITTDILNNCSTSYVTSVITVMATSAFNCPTNSFTLSAPGTFLDVWYNTAYATDTLVTGTTLLIRLREKQSGSGQSWTAGVMLMYVDASGTVTNFNGLEATQVVPDDFNLDYTLDLSGQSATIPAGSKLGIRIRAVSSTSNTMMTYFGSAAGAGGGASGQLTVDEKQTTTMTASSATGTYGGTTNLSATLRTSDGSGVVGKTVAFSLNGSNVGSAVTDSSGVASLLGVSLSGINAGSYPTGVSASFAGDTAFVTSSGNQSLTIAPAPLTITANNVSRAYNGLAYSGGNGVAYSGFVNGETSAVLGGTLAYGGTSQGAINAGASYTIVPSGLTSSNYAITFVNGTLTISKVPLTITANNASKIYDGLAYSGGNGVAYSGFVNGETSAVLGGSLTYGGTSQGAINVGASYTIVPSGLTSSNYTITFVNGTLTISKASLTITANNASKTYDGLAYSGGNGVTYSGFVNGETSAVLGGTLAYGGTSQGAINAGASYTIVPSGLTSSNYAITFVNGNFTITPKVLTVTGITANDKTYDGNTTATLNLAGANLVGVLFGDDATLNTGGASGAFSSANVGTWTVTVSGLTLNGTAKNNYSVIQPTTTASILGATASVTGITANNKTYDGNNVASLNFGGAHLVGIVPGDSVTLNTSGASATFSDKNVGTGKLVTITGLTLSGPDAGKYSLTQPTASANITARGLTVSASASNKAYDGTTTASVTLSTNALAGDTVSATFTTADFDTANIGTGKTVTVAGIALDGADAGNYNLLNVTATATADITAGEIIVTANNQTKVANQPDPVFTFTASGFVGSDTFVTPPTCSVPAAHTVIGGYDIVCSGGDAGANYIITSYVNGTLTVTAIPVTLRSAGTQDGWLLESGENTNVGGTMDNTATTIRIGDDAARKQYRSVLSFATGATLPDNAVIVKVTLKVRQQGIVGSGNPLTMFQGIMVDIRKGLFGTSVLQVSDWQAAASKTLGPFKTPASGGWFTINLSNAKAYINKLSTGGGLTQIRLRFKLDDNNNSVANYLSLFSGNAGAASRPQLIVEYYIP